MIKRPNGALLPQIVALLCCSLVSLVSSASGTAYLYDDLGRLSAVITPSKTKSYQYDDAGNRTSTSVQNGGLDTQVDVGVTLTATPLGQQIIGNHVLYTVEIVNFSSIGTAGLTLQLTLDATLDHVATASGAWTCVGAAPIECTLTSLPAEVVDTLTFEAIPRVKGQTISSASVTHGASDPQSANDTDSLTLPIIGSGDPDDTDGDGLPDVWEVQNALDPLDAADAALDSDGDNLSNGEEYLLGTDPHNTDTDGDGLADDVDDDPTFNLDDVLPSLRLLLG